VGRVHRILSATSVLVCAASARSDRYETWLLEEWDVTCTRVPEDVRSLVPDVDLLVVTDRTLRGELGDLLSERPRRREEEAMLGIVTGDGFDRVDPDAELTAPPDPDTFTRTARQLRTRSAYDAALREYYSLVDCLSAMEANRAASILEDDPVYEQVLEAEESQTDRVEALRDGLLQFGDDVAFKSPGERNQTTRSDPQRRQ